MKNPQDLKTFIRSFLLPFSIKYERKKCSRKNLHKPLSATIYNLSSFFINEANEKNKKYVKKK